jgi:GT2 family glycosyltransferase
VIHLIEIIIIDSSDHIDKNLQSAKTKVSYIHTEIKSAAKQRNLGIDKVSKNTEFTFFLDDDVVIKNDYFETLMQSILESSAIGASGVAINLNKSIIRNKPKGVTGLFKKFFLLDSKKDGKLLKSAINIPCRSDNQSQSPILEVDWLIGCAAWRTPVIKKLRFEESFTGQSLGEDVLFSSKSKSLGKIIVNRNVLINHMESEEERPNQYEFYKMWVRNRYEISKQLKLSFANISFHWANIGTILLNILKKQNNYNTNLLILRGILNGYKEIIKSKK